MAGGNITPQQIQTLLAQTQSGAQQPYSQAPQQSLFSPLSQNRNAAPTGVAQLYQNWVSGLLHPYQQPYTPPQQQLGLLGQLYGQNQQAHTPDWYDPSITPSGGGH